MKFLILFTLFLAASALPSRSEWESFKLQFNKTYTTLDVETYRAQVFQKNVELIASHNERARRGEHSFTLRVNRFADLTFDEFSKTHLGYKNEEKVHAPHIHTADDLSEVPKSIDWRKEGIVAPVKDQGQCGSCWAFSAVASLEARNAQKKGKLIELSEQNLMDCSRKYGDESCNGGLMDNAFKYIVDNKGIDTEKAYPYRAKDEPCEFKQSEVGAVMKSFVDVAKGNENALANAVAIGPVSVAVQATFLMQFYSHGIFNDPLCGSPAQLNHGVAVVGYGSENGKDFWIVRNSWGQSWGEQGYVRFSRGQNLCGIVDAASYPVV